MTCIVVVEIKKKLWILLMDFAYGFAVGWIRIYEGLR